MAKNYFGAKDQGVRSKKTTKIYLVQQNVTSGNGLQ